MKDFFEYALAPTWVWKEEKLEVVNSAARTLHFQIKSPYDAIPKDFVPHFRIQGPYTVLQIHPVEKEKVENKLMHDLKAPVRKQKSYAEMLLSGMQVEDRMHKAADTLLNRMEKMTHFYRNTKSPYAPKSIELKTYLENAAFAYGIQLDVSLAKTHWYVLKEPFDQGLMEVLKNIEDHAASKKAVVSFKEDRSLVFSNFLKDKSSPTSAPMGLFLAEIAFQKTAISFQTTCTDIYFEAVLSSKAISPLP